MSYLQSLNHKVVELAPLVLSGISKNTPKALLRPILQTLLNHLFKRQLRDGDLDFLTRRWIRILVTDMAFSFDLSLFRHKTNSHIAVTFEREKVDLVFSSNSEYLLLLALNKLDPDTLFFQRKLGVQGDTELGLCVKNLLASLDLTRQFPSHLSQWINQLGNRVYEKMSP